MDYARETWDPHRRRIIFDAGSHLHLARRRPWLLEHLDAVMGAIANPDYHSHDPLPGRERYYRRHIDARRWMRVVVDFEADVGWVVTVAIQTNHPRLTR